MNGGGWMGRRLGMAGRILPLLGPTGLNLEGLKMSITLKLVNFVGLSSSLLLFCLFRPLSLLDMLRGWHCWLLLVCDDGRDGDSLWFCDLITESKCSPLELGFWLSLGLRTLLLCWLLWWWWWLILDAAVKCEFLWWLKWPWPLKEWDDVILLRGDVTQVLIPTLSLSWSTNKNKNISTSEKSVKITKFRRHLNLRTKFSSFSYSFQDKLVK